MTSSFGPPALSVPQVLCVLFYLLSSSLCWSKCCVVYFPRLDPLVVHSCSCIGLELAAPTVSLTAVPSTQDLRFDFSHGWCI